MPLSLRPLTISFLFLSYLSDHLSLSPLCFLPDPWAPLCLYWVLNPEPAFSLLPVSTFHTLSPSPSVSLLPPDVTDWLRTLEICPETHDVAG